MSYHHRCTTLAIFVIAMLAISLYTPFLNNQLIFDDYGLFLTGQIYDYAQTPFDLRSRTFPYFTLGFIDTVFGTIEANRITSLVLHILSLWVLFLLISTLLAQSISTSKVSNFKNSTWLQSSRYVLAFLGTLWLAINPVAVYGAGYLAQRTILFANLFSLISLWFYVRSFTEKRLLDVVTAALFYALAVFSKEHAIMLPLVALGLTVLYGGSFQSQLQRIALYLSLCLPAALTVLLATKHIVASSYEPDVAAMIPQMHEIAIFAYPWGKWLVSVTMQAGFFFDYLVFWIVPDVRLLSVDIRFDFVDLWHSWWIFPKAFLFFISPIFAIYFLRKKGLIALFCCGFLYCWFLFLTELAAVRFQEPFVLYRSYLWAPGYVMMITAICARASLRWLVIAAIPLFVIFFFLARERLTSLENAANVWEDAATKLASPSLIGSDRIFYNRGSTYLRDKRYEDAIADFSQTIQLNSKVSQAYYNRALAFYALEKYPEAMFDLDRALSLNKEGASIQYARGLVFERRGCIGAATHAYSESMALGNQIAQMKLADLAKKIPASANRERSSNDVSCP